MADSVKITRAQADALLLLGDADRGYVLSRVIDFVFYGEEYPESGDGCDAVAVVIASQMRDENV